MFTSVFIFCQHKFALKVRLHCAYENASGNADNTDQLSLFAPQVDVKLLAECSSITNTCGDAVTDIQCKQTLSFTTLLYKIFTRTESDNTVGCFLNKIQPAFQ